MTTPVTHAVDDGPQIRLVWCKTCGTIDELPDFVPGRDGRLEDDVLLQIIVDKHKYPSGEEHLGQMFRVPVKHWGAPAARKQIIEQMKGGSKGLAEWDDNYYSSRSQFGEDALKCYNLHNRPKEGCPDFRTERKRLVPDTGKDRKELGLDPVKVSGPKVYLCDFCPARVHYSTKYNESKGLYS